MKRIVLILTALIAATVVAVLGTGASDGDSYKVRAIFDDAVSVIPGEDVKIAGVKVGKISSIDVTCQAGTDCGSGQPRKNAAVVLDITEPGFDDFREDATCTIRPQSLIGEKFVECTPTQPRPVGGPQARKLRKIEDGDGNGEHLLPLSQTSSPVDIDLINNILRKPYAERLSIILGELGTGLAGRGKDLGETIRRANPALRETDKVLKILANQNEILANLATDSDTVLGPLADERERVADQFAQSAQVAEATAERGDDLEANFQKLPEFLRQLRPTMVRLGALADQGTPLFTDLGAQAPNINRVVRQLGPFSEASLPAFRTLGQAAEIGGPALTASRPTIQELGRFAKAAKPVARNAALLLDSFRDTGGVERLMDFIFYQVAAINGFDQLGHYLRAATIVNLCTTYALRPAAGCSANFTGEGASSSRLAPEQARQLRDNVAALAGNEVTTTGSRAKAKDDKPIALPKIALPGRLGDALSQGAKAPATKAPEDAATPAPAGKPTPVAGARPPDPRQGLLDYLLGSGS
jgi:phospholipid/cholesterol/gamma-HCH transport system substrate-binding protein